MAPAKVVVTSIVSPLNSVKGRGAAAHALQDSVTVPQEPRVKPATDDLKVIDSFTATKPLTSA
jgi:hypothetical protein